MSYTLICNMQARPMQSFCDLPAVAQLQFDYIEEDDKYSPRFVEYRGYWRDVFDAQCIVFNTDKTFPMGSATRVHPGEPLARFDAIECDSYFSATVFKLVDDDYVIVGRIYS